MLQLTVAGVALGSIYALVAIGFVIIYRATGAVNFAHGDMVTVGAFAALWATTVLEAPILVSWLVAVLMLGVLGMLTYRFVYRPLRHHPFLAVAIATLGLAFVFRGVLFVIFGPQPAALPSPVGGGAVSIGGAVVSRHLLLIIGVTAVLVVSQALFFRHTFLGKSLRATAENQEVARMLGLRTNRIILWTFAYGAGLAAVAGVLLAPVRFVTLDLGFGVLLKAIVGAIVGGFGSLPGALVGGLIVGLAEVFGASLISSAFRDTFAFGILIIILLVRPHGLFQVKAEEKV